MLVAMPGRKIVALQHSAIENSRIQSAIVVPPCKK